MHRAAFSLLYLCCVLGLIAANGCPARSLGVAVDPQCGDGRIEGDEQCDHIVPQGTGCTTLGFGGGTLSCTDTCQLDTTGCLVTPCGNALIDVGEECDGPSLGGATCQTLGLHNGALSCGPGCTFDTSDCLQEDVCGDQTINIDLGEQCDGPTLGDATCQTLGFDNGTLACAADCTFDDSGCTSLLCGNGQLDPGEDCDGPNLDGATCLDLIHSGGDLACTANCRFDSSSCCDHQCPNVWLGHCEGTVRYECEMQNNGCMDWSTYDCSLVYMSCHESSQGAGCGY